jgi:hypothetical protein
MDNLGTSLVTVATAITGIALVAVLVSKNANTANVITSGGNAFSTSLLAAVSPVTGNTPSVGNSSLGGIGNLGLTGFGNSAVLS